MLNFYTMKSQEASAKEISYSFKVEPMMCGNCVRAVTVALAQLNCPTLKLESDIPNKVIKVSVPESIRSQDIIGALANRQITATLVSGLQQNHSANNRF